VSIVSPSTNTWLAAPPAPLITVSEARAPVPSIVIDWVVENENPTYRGKP
jgi:hypothetical protein